MHGKRGPFLKDARCRGRLPTFEVVMAGFTSSAAWSSSLVLAKRGPRSQVLALSALFNKYDNVLFAVFAPSLLCSLWEGTNLPRKSPYGIALTKQEREELERRANKYTLPYFIVARAKMILLAEQGLSNDEIANSLSTRREIVSRWRKRFFEKRLGGLEDFPRPGRPRVFPPRAGRAR